VNILEILYKISNGILTPAPSYAHLEDGRFISNFNLVASEYGYKPLLETVKPKHGIYENLQVSYDEIDTHIIQKWEIVNAIPLDEFKQNKVREFNDLCNQTILNGFTSQGFSFIFDMEAQINFTQQLLMINDKTTSIPWKTEDKGIQMFTKEQFLQIVQDAQAHKVNNIQKYWMIKQRVLDAQSYEDVDAITWEGI
jgi:hypothetical protein